MPDLKKTERERWRLPVPSGKILLNLIFLLFEKILILHLIMTKCPIFFFWNSLSVNTLHTHFTYRVNS